MVHTQRKRVYRNRVKKSICRTKCYRSICNKVKRCKWASGKSRKFCRKAKNTKVKRLRIIR